MRRFLTVFLSFLLLFTTVLVSNNRIYAEEEETPLNDGETYEVTENNDDVQEEEPELIVEESLEEKQEDTPEIIPADQQRLEETGNLNSVDDKQIPEGLIVEENSDGVKFYFDVEEPSAEQLEFLAAMTVPYVYYQYDTHEANSDGTYINISDEHGHYIGLNNSKIIYNSGHEVLNEEIFLSSDGTYVYVPEEVFKAAYDGLTNSEDVYRIRLEAYGYVADNTLQFTGLHCGKETLPEDFAINASLDANCNLSIRAAGNEDGSLNGWIEAAYKPARTDAQSKDYSGSFLHIIGINSTNSGIRFDNYICEEPNNSYSIIQYEIRTDGSEEYLYVSRETLAERFAAYGDPGTAGSKYYFGFATYGYENYYSDPDTDGQYMVLPENLVKEVPELTISETEGGDIIIGSDDLTDENYIAYINDLYYGENSEICIMDNATHSGPVFGYLYEYYGIDLVDNQIVISNQVVVERGITNGEKNVIIRVSGYEEVEIPITLQHTSKQVTSDITVDGSTGDLIVTCNDTDFLNALAQPYIGYSNENGYMHTDGGYITVSYNDSNTSGYFSNREEHYGENAYSTVEYTVSKNKLTIKNAVLLNRYIYDTDSAIVTLCAVGYPALTITNVPIKKTGSTDLPDDVTVTVEDNGDIVIQSKNATWLKALCTASTDTSNGSQICFMDPVGNYAKGVVANNQYSSYYSSSNNKIIISSDTLITYEIMNGDYKLQFRAYKYKALDYGNVITVTGGIKEKPEGIEARVNENGDLIIYSTVPGNEDYLETIARWTLIDKSGKATQNGSFVYFYDANGEFLANKYNYDSKYPNYLVYENDIRYDAENNQTIIARENLGGISGTNVSVRINAYGYVSYSYDSYVIINGLDFPFITVPSASMLAGGRAQFTVNTDKPVTWSVDNPALATVDQDGWLTALEPGTVYLSAQIEGNDYVDTIPVSISVPSNVSITVNPTKKDVNVGDVLGLTVTVKNGGDYYTVNYESSDPEIATVNSEGLVTFLNPGTVTITSSVYGKSAKSVFTVYEVPKGTKLTASIDDMLYDSKNGMEALDSVSLIVKAGNEVVDPSSLEYSSANESIAVINENGLITALKSGSVKITAKLSDDPAKRSVTFSLKVYPRVLNDLSFALEDESSIIVRSGLENGILNIHLNAANSLKETFKLLPLGTDKAGNTVSPETVTYAPVDASVASVDKNGVVTIKKAGQTAIKATVSSNLKGSDPVTCTVIVRVMDYAPRLESNKATVNKYYTLGTDVNIYPIFGSSIKTIKLLNSKLMSEAEQDLDFIVTYTEGEDHFNIKPNYTITAPSAKAKTYSEILRVTLTDGSVYDYAYSVAVSLTLPKTTVKTSGTYNTVLDDNTLKLDVICDEEVSLLLFGDKGETWAWVGEDGYVHLENPSVSKGVLYVSYKNYLGASSKFNVTFKTEKTLPTASLTDYGNGWLNSNTVILSDDFYPFYNVGVVSSNDRFPISNVTVKEVREGLSVEYRNGNLQIGRDTAMEMKNGTYKYTITPYINVNGEEVALKNITLSVKVSNALPKVSLSASTVKLNKNYNEHVKVTVKASDLPAGVGLKDMVITENDIVNAHFTVINQDITFTLKDDVKPGSYKFELTPAYNGVEGTVYGTPVKVTVTVIDSQAKATVSVKGNLNQLDPLSETGCIGTVKLSNVTANVTSVASVNEYVDASLNGEGQIVFTLKDNTLTDQTIKNVVLNITLDTGDVLTSTVSIKVARKAPTVKLEQTTLNVYNVSKRYAVVGTIKLTDPAFGQIRNVWLTPSSVYDLYYDAENNQIVVTLAEPANMKAGTSTAITIKIDWVGDYGTYEQSLTDKTIKGLKTTTLKLTIKDASNVVKTK